MKIIDIISKRKSNFEYVLASQTCVFGKSGLGAQNLFQLSLKNNWLKSRNNRLFVVSTA